MWIASKHAEGMSLRYDESLNLTPSFKTQDTQLTAVPQKRLLFYLPPSFGKLFSKLSAKTEENIRFWQGISKIICQNRGKYQVLARYFQNHLPKSRKISSFGKVFSKLSAKTEKNIEFWQGISKIICQNQGKYEVLGSNLQNCLPKLRKISSFGKVFWIASGRYGGKFVNSQFNGRGVR